MPKKKLFTTKMIATLGLLIAMSIVLTRLLYVMPTENIRIDAGSIPIILAGLLFGPIAGGVTGLLADFLGTSLFSAYGWYPPLALTPVIMGVVPALIGMLLKKRKNIVTFIVMILPAEILGPMVWSSLALHWLNGAPFLPNLAFRAPFKAIVLAFDILVIFLLYKSGVFKSLGLDRFGGNKDELRGDAAVHPQR